MRFEVICFSYIVFFTRNNESLLTLISCRLECHSKFITLIFFVFRFLSLFFLGDCNCSLLCRRYCFFSCWIWIVKHICVLNINLSNFYWFWLSFCKCFCIFLIFIDCHTSIITFTKLNFKTFHCFIKVFVLSFENCHNLWVF